MESEKNSGKTLICFDERSSVAAEMFDLCDLIEIKTPDGLACYHLESKKPIDFGYSK